MAGIEKKCYTCADVNTCRYLYSECVEAHYKRWSPMAAKVRINFYEGKTLDDMNKYIRKTAMDHDRIINVESCGDRCFRLWYYTRQ
jgi:hypothetical protein